MASFRMSTDFRPYWVQYTDALGATHKAGPYMRAVAAERVAAQLHQQGATNVGLVRQEDPRRGLPAPMLKFW